MSIKRLNAYIVFCFTSIVIGLFVSSITKSSGDYKLVKVQEMMEGDGARVKRLFPTRFLKHPDPFIVMDEFFVTPPAGFPDHAHLGFEAITYMLDGAFQHKDNLGNNSIVTEGGAQRFTAGKGIIHSEMPGSKEESHGIQIWINLPKSLKQIDPSYQQVDASGIPVETKKGITIRHIVGGKSSVAIHAKVIYQDITISPGHQEKITLPENFEGFIYCLKGALQVNEYNVAQSEALLFPKNASLNLSASEGARLLLVSGEPLNEPIRQQGPFVY